MRRIVSLLSIVMLGSLGTPAVADSAFLEIRAENWLEAMQISRVDSDLLYGIALAESGTSFNGMRDYGPWPWVMNVEEKPLFYSSREAARKALQSEVELGNKRVAVGMWQIYLRYNGHYVQDPLDLIDPVTNLYAAAMVLKGCGEQYATTRHVLSCYHSGNVDDAGTAYAERVLELAKRWGRPFRMNADGIDVRYVVNDPPPVLIAPLRMEVVVNRDDRTTLPTLAANRVPADSLALPVTASPPPPSIVSMGALHYPLSTRSHTEFLARMNDEQGAWANRVVVVE